MPQLRRVFTTGGARERTLERHRFRTETVLGNLPPAHVHHLAPVAPLLAYAG